MSQFGYFGYGVFYTRVICIEVKNNQQLYVTTYNHRIQLLTTNQIEIERGVFKIRTAYRICIPCHTTGGVRLLRHPAGFLKQIRQFFKGKTLYPLNDKVIKYLLKPFL